MASPTPLNALIGGLSIPVAAHELLLLNGNVYGISGFIHRGIKGSIEGLAGVAGLILGGALIAGMEGQGPANLSLSLPKVLASGFLVGLGTKVCQIKLALNSRLTIFSCRWLTAARLGMFPYVLTLFWIYLDASLLHTINRHMICGISRLSVRSARGSPHSYHFCIF